MTTTSDTPVALITGAGRRVGRAVAVELARAGYDIVIHYNHSADDAERTAAMVGEQGRRAWRVSGGLQNPQMPARIVAEALEQAGRIDVLINNASVFGKMPLEEFDVKKWHDTMQINLAAPIQLCQQVAPAMRARGGGCIVNFCDARSDRPSKHYLAYGPSKAGLDYATRALARALAPEIRVTGVAPGIAVFPEDYSRELRAKLVSEVPLRREGTPEAMAGAVRFLVEADYITGQIINVDGGWSVA